jgi:hypothetical protein
VIQPQRRLKVLEGKHGSSAGVGEFALRAQGAAKRQVGPPHVARKEVGSDGLPQHLDRPRCVEPCGFGVTKPQLNG